MISLNSKTYLLTSENETKLSCKGISKRSVVDPKQIFQRVIDGKEKISATNRGIRMNESRMTTYEQTRAGFSYYYIKREVLADGISTKPLDFTLNPWPKQNAYIFPNHMGDPHIFTPDYPSKITIHNVDFPTLEHAFIYEKLLFHKEHKLMSNIKPYCIRAGTLHIIRNICKSVRSEEWNRIQYEKMKLLYRIKLNTSHQMKQLLLDTRDVSLVYGLKGDKFWSSGMSSALNISHAS